MEAPHGYVKQIIIIVILIAIVGVGDYFLFRVTQENTNIADETKQTHLDGTSQERASDVITLFLDSIRNKKYNEARIFLDSEISDDLAWLFDSTVDIEFEISEFAPGIPEGGSYSFTYERELLSNVIVEISRHFNNVKIDYFKVRFAVGLSEDGKEVKILGMSSGAARPNEQPTDIMNLGNLYEISVDYLGNREHPNIYDLLDQGPFSQESRFFIGYNAKKYSAYSDTSDTKFLVLLRPWFGLEKDEYLYDELKIKVESLIEEKAIVPYLVDSRYCELDTDCSIRSNFCGYGAYNNYSKFFQPWGCAGRQYQEDESTYADICPNGYPKFDYGSAKCIEKTCVAQNRQVINCNLGNQPL